MIKRMIKRQYDQLLEVCKQTKAEIEYLDRELKDSDFVQRLEIERTQRLIASIEHDIQLKKQELYNSEIKNRYQQLMTLYQQTKDEVGLLEATLEDRIEGIDESQEINFKLLNEREFQNPNLQNLSSHQLKRERLNLSASTEEQHHDNSHYELIMKKWHESLEKINELETQQQKLETSMSISDVKPVKEMSSIPMPPLEEEAADKQDVLESNSEDIEAKLPSMIQMTPKESDEVKQDEFRKKPQEPVPILATNNKVAFEQKSNKRNRAASIILNSMFYFILISAILVVSLFSIQSRVVFGHSLMRVATRSMEPVLPVNTLIVTRHVDPAELQVDDIVTFVQADETTITHRIHHIYENYQNSNMRGFRLIGEANNGIPDPDVHLANNLVGRVIASNTPIGHFLMFVHHHFLFIMIVLILILIILFLSKKKFLKIKED